MQPTLKESTTTDLNNLASNLAHLSIQAAKPLAQPEPEEPTVAKSDLALLRSLEIVDQTGALLPKASSSFATTLNDEALHRVLHFLDNSRQLGSVTTTIRALLKIIQQKMQELTKGASVVSDPRLVGEELYRLLGCSTIIDILTKLVRDAQDTLTISSERRSELEARTSKAPESLTLRYQLQKQMPVAARRSLIVALHSFLQEHYKTDALSKCFAIDDEGTHFSGFSIILHAENQPLRLSCIFTTELQHEFVATADALQLALPQTGHSFPYFIDNHCGNQWAIDCAFKLLRIPKKSSHLSKVLFRYLKEGYQPTGNELTIFKNEHLTNCSTYSLLSFCNQLQTESATSPEQLLLPVFLVAQLANHFGIQEPVQHFVIEALKVHKTRFPHFAPSGLVWQSLELVSKHGLPFAELQDLLNFFAVLFKHDEPLGLPFQYDLQKAFSTLATHQSILGAWLECYCTKALRDEKAPEVSAEWSAKIQALSPTTLAGFLGHVLLLQTHPFCFDVLVKSVPKLISTSDEPIGKFVRSIMQTLFSKHGLPFPLQKLNGTNPSPSFTNCWIEHLLLLPTLQHLGAELLCEADVPIDMKKKWLKHFLKTSTGLDIRLIVQVQEMSTKEEMREWMKLCRQKSTLFIALFTRTDTKWLAAAMAVDPLAVLDAQKAIGKKSPQLALTLLWDIIAHERASECSKELLLITSQVIKSKVTPPNPTRLLQLVKLQIKERELTWPEEACICYGACCDTLNIKEHFQFIFHPVAVAYAVTQLAESIRILQERDVTVTPANKTHLRVLLKPLILALIKHHFILALRLISMYRKYCGDVTDEEIKKSIFSTFKSQSSYHEDLVGWYVQSSDFFPPRLETAEQVKLLLNFCIHYPKCIVQGLDKTVQQLEVRLKSTPEYEGLARQVLATQLQVSQTVPHFDTIFAPFLAVKKGKTQPSNSLQGVQALIAKGKYSDAANVLGKQNPQDTQAVKLACECIKAMLRTKPAVLNTVAVELIQHFQVTTIDLWVQLFEHFDLEINFKAIALLISTLYAMNATPPFSTEQKTLWEAILAHPGWICEPTLLTLLNNPKFFENTVKHLYPNAAHTKFQEIAIHITKTLIQTTSEDYHRVAQSWLKHLDNDGTRFQMGCDLLKKLAHASTFKLATKLALLLASDLPVLVLGLDIASLTLHLPKQAKAGKIKIQTKADLVQQFVFSAEQYLKFGLSQMDDQEVAGQLRQVVEELVDAEVIACDSMLFTLLKNRPLHLREWIIPSLARLISQRHSQPVKTITFKDLINCLEGLLRTTSPEALFDIYHCFFTEESRLPSLSTIDTMIASEARKTINEPRAHDPDSQKLRAILTANYSRLFSIALTSSDNSFSQNLLDIDISISYLNSEFDQMILRKELKNYHMDIETLFLRHIEGCGWMQDTIRLLHHRYYLALSTAKIAKSTRADVKEDDFEIVQIPMTKERFYTADFLVKHPAERCDSSDTQIAYAQPVISKTTAHALPSEQIFLSNLHASLYCAFQKLTQAKPPLAKARMLDYIAQSLRTLMELYPRELMLPTHLLKFTFAIDKNDPFYPMHCKIAYALLQRAWQVGILSADTATIVECFEHLGKASAHSNDPNNRLLTHLEEQIKTLQAATTYAIEDLIGVHNKWLYSYETHEMCDEELLQMLRLVTTLWQKQPEILTHTLVLKSIDALLLVTIPLRNTHSFEIASSLFEGFFSCYTQMLQKPASASLQNAQNTLLYMVLMLKRTVRMGAFNNHFSTYVSYLKRLIPQLAENSKINPANIPTTIIAFTHLLSLACNEPGFNRQQVLLMNEWITTICTHKAAFEPLLIQCASMIVKSSILLEITPNEEPILKQWLTFFDSFEPEDRHHFKEQLFQQLSILKMRYPACFRFGK